MNEDLTFEELLEDVCRYWDLKKEYSVMTDQNDSVFSDYANVAKELLEAVDEIQLCVKLIPVAFEDKEV